MEEASQLNPQQLLRINEKYIAYGYDSQAKGGRDDKNRYLYLMQRRRRGIDRTSLHQ